MSIAQKPWEADISINLGLAELLIRQQFALNVQSISAMEAGWDNQPFLVNEHLVFRFPRRKVAVALLERESAILPEIAPQLPVPIPCPIYKAFSAPEFPYPFHGYALLAGIPATRAQVPESKMPSLARGIGFFLQRLHSITLPEHCLGVLPVGSEHCVRGAFRDCIKRIWGRLENISKLGLIQADEIALFFKSYQDVAACAHEQECLVHGDLYFPHLLIEDGSLSGIIDWGDMHIGDPAVDLAIAFQYFPAKFRSAFFDSYGASAESTLLRARLWAAYSSVTQIWYGHHNGKEDLVMRGLLGCKHVLEL